MAECIGNGDSSLQVSLQTNDKISEYICINCCAYESQLNNVLEEWKSARTIIDILQREVPATITTQNTCNEQTTTKEWTTISPKNNSSKPKNRNLCKTTKTGQYFVTANKFAPLNYLQAKNAESNELRTIHEQGKQLKQISTQNMNKTPNQHRKGIKIPTITNGKLICDDDRQPTARKKEERKGLTGTRTSHKVKILGDSHLRGIAPKIDRYLNTRFEVSSWIKPGATTKEIVNTLGNDLKCLGTQDVIVMNGGTNDIDSKRNQTYKVLVHMAQFI